MLAPLAWGSHNTHLPPSLSTLGVHQVHKDTSYLDNSSGTGYAFQLLHNEGSCPLTAFSSCSARCKQTAKALGNGTMVK